MTMIRMTCLACVLGAMAMGCGAVDDAGQNAVERASALTGCSTAPPRGFASVFTANAPAGDCQTLAAGPYATPQLFHLNNDAITSVRLGTGMRIVLFSDSNFGGTKTLLTANADSLPKNTSSLRVEYAANNCESPSYRPTATGVVALYHDINYGGDCVVIDSITTCAALQVGGAGHYPVSATCIGLPNDSISSAWIGRSTTVNFFHDDWYGGPNEVMQNTSTINVEGQPDFRNNSIGSDQVSSLIITSP